MLLLLASVSKQLPFPIGCHVARPANRHDSTLGIRGVDPSDWPYAKCRVVAVRWTGYVTPGLETEAVWKQKLGGLPSASLASQRACCRLAPCVSHREEQAGLLVRGKPQPAEN